MWILFGVLVSLAPLVANVVTIKISNEPSFFDFANEQSLTFLQLVSYKGELLLLAVGLSATGIGDVVESLLSQDARWRKAKALILGLCLLNVIFGIFLYVATTVLYEQFGMDEIATVTWISLGSYTAAGMTSGVCVALAGER
jgi:uncharacterized membrane protein